MEPTPPGDFRYVQAHRYRMLTAGVPVFDLEQLYEQSHSWDEWMAACVAKGEEYEQRADGELAAGHAITAASHYQLAGLLYHIAQFLFYGDNERKRAVYKRAAATFAKAIGHMAPAAERVLVPFQGGNLVGYLRKPAGADGAVPWVMVTPGLEATKEEIHTFGQYFLERGLAAFVYDGPGQGESWDTAALDATTFPAAVSAIIDQLSARPDLSTEQVGIVGVSLGGLLAPLAAAHEKRIRACVAVDGPFDFGARWKDANLVMRQGYQFVTKASTLEEAGEKAAPLSLAPLVGEYDTPTLLVNGERDVIIPPEHARRFAASNPHVELVAFPQGSHVCNNIPGLYRPLVADWMADRLTGKHV